MKLGLGAVALLFLASCATQNVPGTASYRSVPDQQIINHVAQPSPEEAHAIVVAKRDPGMVGVALSSVFLVNGKPVARVKPGEFTTFRIAPGEHIFGVSWSDNLGTVATESIRELAVDCKPGQTYYLRMFPQAGSGIAIERASQ